MSAVHPNRRFCVVMLGLLGALTGCTSAPVPDPNVVYVAFGDSATNGPAERDYTYYLPGLLGAEADAITNEGNGGETVAEGAERLAGLLEAGLYPNARTLVIWEGGNDLVDFVVSRDPLLVFTPQTAGAAFGQALEQRLNAIQSGLEAMVRSGLAAGLQVYLANYPRRPQVLINCGALPLGVMTPPQAANANQYLDLLNARIEAAAANTGAGLVDIYSLSDSLDASITNFFDCNHLSSPGNELVAGLVAQSIAR